jgi:porin
MYRRMLRRACVAALAFLPAEAGRSFAGSSEDQAATTLPLPDYLQQLTDWGGVRAKLEQSGLRFVFTYYGDAFANPVGGVSRGEGYDGRFGAIMEADLEKLIGWRGADFHLSIQQIHGTQYSVNKLDNLMTVSGVEATPSTRLFNLWLAQDFGDAVNVRVGQFTAAQEFTVSENAGLFVNSTFGWPALSGVDLPSGGPNYPEATPGIRFQYSPNRQFTFKAAMFDGNPAGPGSGDPIARDPYGLAFRVNDPPFFIAEISYAYDHAHNRHALENARQEDASKPGATAPPSDDLPNDIKIGAWINTGSFADQRFNSNGGLLAASGAPLQHRNDYAIYGIVDHELWHDKGNIDRSLDSFVRVMGAPADRNLIDLYVDAGLSFKGPLKSRPDDTIGIGFAIGRISPQAAAYTRDLAFLTGTPAPVPDYEAVIELTYQWMLAKDWSIQPDLQYVIHPGGNIANPLSPGSAIANALVLGVQTSLKF